MPVSRRGVSNPQQSTLKPQSVENWDLFFQHYRKSRAWREFLLASALEQAGESSGAARGESQKKRAKHPRRTIE